jgi:branched-chain amino acid transport system substrate-binding protein
MKRIFLCLLISGMLGGSVAAVMVMVTPQGALSKEPIGEELKIGLVGTFSGPSATWGLSNKYSTMAIAESYNKEGGVLISGVRHPIKLLIEDDKFDPKLARSAVEKLIYRDNVKYIIGPNTSATVAAAQVVSEPAKVIIFGYGYTKTLYTADKPYTVFGTFASWQSAPFLYQYLIANHKVKTVSMVAKNYAGAINTREWCKEAANKLGLRIISDKETYEPDAVDFFPVMGSVVKGNPDVIDLTAAGATDAAQAAKAARQLGYKGIICMHTVGDIKVFKEIAGDYAEGIICPGGVTHPAIRTEYMEKFMEAYKRIGGEWNEEGATKLYTLEMILKTMRIAGTAALKDTDAFKAAMPKVAYKNPYVKGNPIMRFVGKETFGQANQIGVPVVYVQVQGDEFKVIIVGPVEK